MDHVSSGSAVDPCVVANVDTAGVGCRRVWTLAIPCALLAVGSLAVWRLPRATMAPALAAAMPPDPDDVDGDGLHAALEVVLGTNPNAADSDGDGYSDGEELARGSSPKLDTSLPNAAGPSAFMAAYALPGTGSIRSVAALYLSAADGDWDTKTLSVGVRVKQHIMPLSQELWWNASTIFNQTGSQGGKVRILDWPFNGNYITRFGSLSFFTKISNGTDVLAAGVTNLVDMNGTKVEFVYTSAASLGARPGGVAPTGTGYYRPVDASSVPLEWTPGSICVQTLHTLGSQGPIVTHEVVDADCEVGFDASCSPDCESTLGDTIDILDPGVLIGG